MQKWTQDEAIAFECAREAITHLRAILTSEIHDESKKTQPDNKKINALCEERSKLFREREDLHVEDQEKIKNIRYEYGLRIKNWKNKNS